VDGRSPFHEGVSNAVLAGGITVLLGILVLEYADVELTRSVNRTFGPSLAILLALTTVVTLIALYERARASRAAAADADSNANSLEMGVDRKISKRSVTSQASTAASEVIFHAPSGSLERVVGSGDLEQALPESLQT
jgi:hypothetical protein